MAVWLNFSALFAALAAGRAGTDEKFQALAENTVALAEQVSGAPKIRRVNEISTGTVTGLGDFEGIEFTVSARNNSGSSQNLLFEYSTNGGSTWSTPSTVAALSASGGAFFGTGYFDFASGELGFVGANVLLSGSNWDEEGGTSTMAGASLSIDAVRFSGTSITVQVHVRPCGATI